VRGRRASGIRAVLTPLVFLTGCSGGEPQSEVAPEAVLLDRTFLGSDEELLLCGRFEVTWGEFGNAPEGTRGDLPATFMSRSEAMAWAASRGLRLPTREEWRGISRGNAGEARATRGVNESNSLELGLGKTLPVGVFERGRTPGGGYDFQGNVWEWLAPSEGSDPETAHAVGGSYASRPSSGLPETWELNPQDRAEDLGFRYVMDAIPFLTDRILPVWLAGGEVDRQMLDQAIGRWDSNQRATVAGILAGSGTDSAFCAWLVGEGSG